MILVSKKLDLFQLFLYIYRMEIQLNRALDTGTSTIGLLKVLRKVYVTLEDTYQEEKINGQTRIKRGRYEIKFREVESGLTMKYRKKYDWFKWHLWLQDVPEFDYVYMHIGNFAKNTDGCILVAEIFDSSRPDMIINSEKAFKEFYRIVSNELYNGNQVYINIR